MSTVIDLFDTELDIQTTATNPVWLGKKQPNARYPRPLHVTVEDEQMKWKVFKASKNLKNLRKEENKLICIKRDKTHMERAMEEDLEKRLAEKRKEAKDASSLQLDDMQRKTDQTTENQKSEAQ